LLFLAGLSVSKPASTLCRVVVSLALASIAPIAAAQASYPSRPIKPSSRIHRAR
jgi:hypothetical protein